MTIHSETLQAFDVLHTFDIKLEKLAQISNFSRGITTAQAFNLYESVKLHYKAGGTCQRGYKAISNTLYGINYKEIYSPKLEHMSRTVQFPVTLALNA